MPPLTNSERQRRFRELTLKDRELKVAAFDLLVATIDAEQSTEIPLADGRQLEVIQRDGHAQVQIVANAKRQSEIARARFSVLYEK